MVTVDTNILVRLVTKDDSEQSAQALRIIQNNNIFVPKTVLLETEWVLRFSYDCSRNDIRHYRE